MVYCAAVGCTNGSKNNNDVGYFRINIRRPDIQKKWVAALNREGLTVTKNTVVCSQHFEADCFERDLKAELLGTKKIRLLKPDAVPTISLEYRPCLSKKYRNTKENARNESGMLSTRVKYQAASSTTTVQPDSVEIKTEPSETQPDIQMPYQAPTVKMVSILPPRLSLSPEANVNDNKNDVSREDNIYSDRNPKASSASVRAPQSSAGTTDNYELGRGQPTHQMTAQKKGTIINRDREDEPATKNFSREDDNIANRMSHTIPGVVQVILHIRPDVDLAILQTTLASIVYAELVEKDQYYMHIVNDHLLQLQKVPTTIKAEVDDPRYYQAKTESSDLYSGLSSMDPQSVQTVDIPLTQPTDLFETVRGEFNTGTASTESALQTNILETGNPGSETETASTVTASDIEFIYDDESPPLSEHSHPSETERCRTERPVSEKKERLQGTDSLKKTFAEGKYTGLKPVPMTSESTFLGGVETHHDCHFCDFTTLDMDELFYHMSQTHRVNMETYATQPLYPSFGSVSKSESRGNSTVVVENRPSDFIEKETDNDMDVYKCRECCYTFRRESAALSHVKMKHLNKEVAILYENLKRADARSASKKRRDSDESFSLSECSESSHDEEIEDDDSDGKGIVKVKEAELKSKTKSVNEEYVKTVEENGSLWFECTVCENRWPTMASLSKHISMTHSKKQCKTKKKATGVFENAKYVQTLEEKGLVWFECTFCGDRWGTMRSVNKHISLMHNKKNKTPIKSKTKFGNEEYAKTVKENGSEWFECTLCGDRWATMRSLSKHVSLTHSEKNKVPVKVFVCDLCGVSCASLGSHKKTYHKSENQTKDERGVQVPYRRKRASAPIKCPKYGCGKILANKFGLSGHIISVHGPKSPCDICGKEFTQRHLRSHMEEVHLQIRKYDCTWPDCDKKFVNKWHLRIHMRIHTNEKPLQCELCGFRARQWNSLRYHVKKHHGDSGLGKEDI